MSDPVVSLKKLARNRRFEELESALLEAIEDDILDGEDLVAVLNLAAHRGGPEELDSLFWIALGSYLEKHGPEEGLKAARDAAPLFPEMASIREDLVSALVRANEGYPRAEEVARNALLPDSPPLPAALETADALFRLPPGTCVLARGEKIPERVVGPNEDGTGVVLEGRDAERTLPLDAAAALSPLAEDDYRALAVFEPERFLELAAERPSGLVESLLRIHGPRLTYRDLRAHLVDLLPLSWSDWWGDARPEIRRSAWIEMTASNQPTLELRRSPVSHDEEIRAEIEDAEGIERVEIVLDFLDESGEHAAAETELLEHFAEVLAELAGGEDTSAALASLAVFDILSRVAPEPPESPPFPEVPSPAAAMAPLGNPRLEDAVLDLVRSRRREDWAEFFAVALPVLSPEVCERAGADLAAAGHEDSLYEAARVIMASPRRFPGGLVWLWKQAAAGALPPESGGPDRADLLSHLLGSLDRASRGNHAKSPLASLLQSALAAHGWKLARQVLAAIDLAGARRFKAVLERSHSVTDNVRIKLQDILADAHPRVYVTDTPPWLREDVIFTTAAGLERKEREYSKLVHERLPEIADAIGRAAAFGDLSENAEYTAALEERERMTERANSLKADLDRAREIPAEHADSPTVTVGSRVRVRDSDRGEEREYSFLGPWDVDVANGIYSYRAPLSQAFMGRSPGDVVTISADGREESLEILSVESATA